VLAQAVVEFGEGDDLAVVASTSDDVALALALE
jgi:hypothetical protein